MTRRVIAAAALSLLALSACGGGSDDYSEADVIQAFAKQGIELDELIRPGEGSGNPNPLEVILTPPTGESDELTVNLFTNEREHDDYLARVFGRVFEGCRTVERVMGCKQRNILLSLELASRRFDAQMVERALAQLP